ncbi:MULTISPECIES: HlyD family efflux transporter periplasmic adaptor subunit [unclassified Frigoribacterium]|jgi:multidrug resistance efflux pump|uniref:HlyD family efflux transporter periplasmic adaptor subunit n=1 Tax=unclassified Frigoribacterium TaxID=2627005 RepID=UPI000FB62E3B|nr:MULTISPECIES: HlyD family efflux transporter periplasmic adaptor subunit [unclassified Frigoribacterium]MBD8583156.1 biotin/lipoyl-binding protein [Frigoribacterium sp. CFBP 8766]MBD8611065.1 biotin/lipoyl-binding protein [Frigoribacterium sp. CFBP 13729]MBF4580576.1 biotin/lipoyl-binding protein [Frigoribacterium sp. VKM Ac-2530]ROP75301.1 biotin/lipoyl-binding protein [Frigoribacterium sp. PhB107]TDT63856.1 biotin/lipoyl-binding protein [Frigoribacterium sp. PhB116]
MTWMNRLKMTAGMLVVLVLVAAFTMIFTQRQQQVNSTSAEIAAQEYSVGTDYSGTITRSYVENGDEVKEGDTLFEVQSLSLLQDISRGLVTYDTATYSVAPDGTLTLKAAVDGTVADVLLKEGSFVQAGGSLGTIDKEDTLFVAADFVLTPRDYERIESGAEVDLMLPNQTTITGKVGVVNVETKDGDAETTLQVSSDQLVEGAYNGLVTPGTPVEAKLHLRDDGVLAGPVDSLTDFLRQIGV